MDLMVLNWSLRQFLSAWGQPDFRGLPTDTICIGLMRHYLEDKIKTCETAIFNSKKPRPWKGEAIARKAL